MTNLERLEFRMRVAQQRADKWGAVAYKRQLEWTQELLRLQAIESVKKMDHPSNTHEHD